MRARKSSPSAVICLFLGLVATISLAQQAPDGFSPEDAGAGAKLVVTSVSGPATAIHNQTVSVTYTVKNLGSEDSGYYKAGLYLSTDNKIDPAVDRLLDKRTFSTGLAPGQSKQTTTKVLVPINGLSGNYYYGAIVGTSKKASSKQVSLVRYSLGDNNETVTDHKTGLIWQQGGDGIVRNFADAGQYCEDLVLGGKADWRLPSLNELETIVDYSRTDPAIDPVFSTSPYFAHSYWSSSNYFHDPDYAWYVGFQDGGTGLYGKTNIYGYARCVRGGP
jgi:hypothetical protein